MKKLKLIEKWIFGIVCIIVGIALIPIPLAGITAILLGLFILPPTYEILEKKIKIALSAKVKVTIVIIGIIVIIIGINNDFKKDNIEKDKKIDLIVHQASMFIESGNMDSALVLINEAKRKYSNTSQNNAVDLENEIINSTSESFADNIIYKMSDEEFDKLKSGVLKKTYLTHKTLNENFYSLLRSKISERQRILKERKEKEEQERIEQENKRKRKLEAEQKEKREELVKSQFSSWDGSHPGLNRLIKKHMNDPDSFEHVGTAYYDHGEYITVVTQFRGNNAFGGKVLNTITAKVDFKGNVIEIISQN